MKKLYTLTLSSLLLMSVQASAQCTVNITASTNDTVCSGASTTLTANVNGPATSLNTTMAAGNNHRGNMFDITAINTVTITSFDASPMGATTIEIYYKTGTWVGFNNNSAAWTLVGSAAVPAVVLPTPVPVPVPVNITIPAGQTYAFYVTSNNTAVSLNYTDGTAVGNVFSSDANIQFREGCGTEYPFSGGAFMPRVWNGVIHYSTASGSPTYLWNTTATTSSIVETINATSTYSVDVTVPGCPSTLTATFTMTTSTPTANAGSSFAVCDGSTATLSGNGTGNGPLQYTWDQSVTDNVPFTPAQTDNYVLTVTDAYGCTATSTTTITVDPLPAVVAPADFSVCAGDPATLAGSGALTYTWDNSVTDNTPFVPAMTLMYHVTGTDANGCMNWDSTLVTVNSLPVVNAGNDVTVCEGTPVTLSGSGATSYSWSGGVTDAVPFNAWMTTTYSVTGTDANGCSATDDVTVNIYAVNAGVSVVNETITADDTNAVSYQWIDCNTMQPIAGETNYWFTATVNGSYAVIITDSMCTDTSACEIILSTGINANSVSAVSAYPNPTDGSFVLNTGAVAERIQVVNVTGQTIADFVPLKSVETINLEGNSAGVYFVHVYQQGGIISTLKVVRQ